MVDHLRLLRSARALGFCALAAACFWSSGPGLAPQPQPIVWRDCGNGAACAELRAPLDYEAPAGAEIQLAVLRIPAAKPAERIGVLFVNPGGPGVSAIAFLRGNAGRYAGVVRDRFDLVAVDPRGTGGSAPLDCHGELTALLALDPDASDDAAWQALVDSSRAFAEECARKHGELLPFLGTAESARDLDWVRAALGEEKISYLGYSYGTALGATYATLFPQRVRALVLDGSIDPSFELEPVRARAGDLGRAGAGRVRHRGAAQGLVRRRLARRSLRARSAEEHGALRRGRRRCRRRRRAGAIWRWRWAPHEEGETGAFDALADRYFGRRSDGSSALAVEAQIATLCADTHRPKDAEAFRAALPEFAAAAPHFGRANLLSHLPCAFWPEPARALGAPGASGPAADPGPGQRPRPAHAARLGRAPGGALPERDADRRRRAARTRPTAATSPCVDELVDAYLVAPAAPARTSCP